MSAEMEQWQSGDLDAFEALFREHQRAVFRTAYLMCGSRQEAEDVLQEVFLSVWRFKKSFDPSRAGVSTWLHRITFNECMKNHHVRDKYAASIEGLDFPAAVGKQPEQVLITKSEYEKLLSTLSSMDKKHRAVLILRYFNDLPYSEIADVLDIPLGTVKSRLNQALGCLRQKMAPEAGA